MQYCCFGAPLPHSPLLLLGCWATERDGILPSHGILGCPLLPSVAGHDAGTLDFAEDLHSTCTKSPGQLQGISLHQHGTGTKDTEHNSSSVYCIFSLSSGNRLEAPSPLPNKC